MSTQREEALWEQVDKMWNSFDATIVEFERVSKLAGEVIKEKTQSSTTGSMNKHTVNFKASTFTERRRLVARFVRMAWQVMWSGTTQIQFRPR